MTMDLALTIGTILAMVGILTILILTAVEAVREAVEHGKGDAWEAGHAAGVAYAIAVYDAAVEAERVARDAALAAECEFLSFGHAPDYDDDGNVVCGECGEPMPNAVVED